MFHSYLVNCFNISHHVTLAYNTETEIEVEIFYVTNLCFTYFKILFNLYAYMRVFSHQETRLDVNG